MANLLFYPILIMPLCSALVHRPLDRPYNILMMTPVSSKSHIHVFIPIATALTERGHNVTLLSGNPPYDDNPRIRYVDHGVEFMNYNKWDSFRMRDDYIFAYKEVIEKCTKFTKMFYDIPQIKELYEQRDQYDIFFVDNYFNEIVLPFVHGKTFVTLSMNGIEHVKSAIFGNVQNPSYTCHALEDYPRPFSFISKIKNVLMSIAIPFAVSQTIMHIYETELNKIFPELPSLYEIERNQSLVFLNSHWSFSNRLPLLPSQVDIGGIHINKEKHIPKDIFDFLSGNQSAIYITFGSAVQAHTMPPGFKQMLISAIKKLPYKILWQYGSNVTGFGSNVLVRKWFPQQDLLAHPNLKLFVNHGGHLGIVEALHHAVPMICLPVVVDHPRNAQRMANHGLGLVITWESFNEEIFLKYINEVMDNPKYRERTLEVSKQFREQLDTPLERAVFWTEYVVRHRGATHLRPPERDLSWIVYLNLDVLAVLFGLPFVCWKTMIFILKKLKESSKTNNYIKSSKSKSE